MKHIIAFCLVALCAFTVPPVARAANKASRQEAVTMVQAAVEFFRAYGVRKTLAEVSNPKGRFIYRDLYLSVLDLHGKVVAHGTNPGLIGKDVSNSRDADDKRFIRELLFKAKTEGKGSVDYQWTNPHTQETLARTIYLERVGSYVIACGT